MTKKSEKPVHPTLLDLNVLYRAHEPAPPWLGELLRSGRFFTFDLPTEFVLHPTDDEGNSRKIGNPLRLATGRVYQTGLYDHHGEFMTFHELQMRIPKAARKALDDGLLSGPNLGAYHNCELLVAEVWTDHGDEGHVSYKLAGHMLYIEQHLPLDLAGKTILSVGTKIKKEEPLYHRIEMLAYDTESQRSQAQKMRERDEVLKAREAAVAQREAKLDKPKGK